MVNWIKIILGAGIGAGVGTLVTMSNNSMYAPSEITPEFVERQNQLSMMNIALFGALGASISYLGQK